MQCYSSRWNAVNLKLRFLLDALAFENYDSVGSFKPRTITETGLTIFRAMQADIATRAVVLGWPASPFRASVPVPTATRGNWPRRLLWTWCAVVLEISG